MKIIPPAGFPYTWCSNSGEDKFGFWLEFTLKRITRRMRWIRQGHFSMGSPYDELHRHHYETRYEVTLSKGFWITDTACTQELWNSIMEKNPGTDFNQKEPVVNVSWDDCDSFLKKMNGLLENVVFSLPTEAQWEYACRAGTTDPFSFGMNISPEQVNYNGNYPYLGDTKGLNRGKTVAVKSLPANQWGLYKMHGNVWEWCKDWYGDYNTESVTDPAGPANRKYRVLRGGSAFSGAADCRSAARSRCHSDGRYKRNGFRFVWNPLPPENTEKQLEEEKAIDDDKSKEKDKGKEEYVIIPEKEELVARDITMPKDKMKKIRKGRM